MEFPGTTHSWTMKTRSRPSGPTEFKNPWKITFDAVTGDLWLGDVGLDLWEPVFFVEKGGNYGWSIVEGGQSMRSDMQPGPTPIQSAVIVHPRDEARSLTGGFVYRGTKLKELHGAYIYGDYVTGKIWGLRYDGNQVTLETRARGYVVEDHCIR